MLGADQIRRWVDYFGTPENQVRRDHLISHVLVHLPAIVPTATFFGGTALCRTHLPDWRLSEDIDLLVQAAAHARQSFDDTLPAALRREYPGVDLRWTREGLSTVGTVSVEDLSIRIQLVPTDASYGRYPAGPLPVLLRYEDLPPTVDIVCPTREGATAMKLNAWAERAAARDLCDLYGLAQAGAITRDAIRVARSVSSALQRHTFAAEQMPSVEGWQAALGQQMRIVPDRQSAFEAVRSAIATLEQWDE